MAVLQSKLDEIRYLKRQNLEEEAKLIGNYYRDIIRQFAIDCNYYKLKIPYSEYFKPIIDENNKIRYAYGEEPDLNYKVSSDMLTYMEVENDIFQLNKYGVIPNMDVNFYFDSTDFACSLAYKLGQLKEYKIKEQIFAIEVPAPEDLTEDVLPYGIGHGKPEFYESDILSGKFEFTINEPYVLNKKYTVMVHPYEHGDLAIRFPTNDTIYKSFEHVIDTKEFVDHMLFIDYKVNKSIINGQQKYILKGKLYGAILFHDLNKIGKYIDMIHPEVGDIITIDFPDENNRQRFEIVDCFDKNLTNDGINPLLHKYVWKCKARRYINSGEDFPETNEADERLEEKLDFINDIDETIAREISTYDEDNSDDVYGGYERELNSKDKQKVDHKKPKTPVVHLDVDQYIEILVFHDSSRLLTDGYDLYYMDTKQRSYKIGVTRTQEQVSNTVFQGIQYLKATDNALYFVNFDNEVLRICDDIKATSGEVELCLNSLLDTTYDRSDNNYEGDFYYKFRECNTVLFSLNDSLFCRLGNKSHQMIKIIDGSDD